MKKAIIIHRWEGNPNEPLYTWISDQLKAQGFEVQVPEMPNSEAPKIKSWLNKLSEVCPNPDEEILLIGHSIGCQTILRYLETLSSGTKIKKCIFIAPWLHLQGLEDEETEEIAKPWIETPINFEKVKTHTKNFTCIFSDNDPFVPLSDRDIFEKLLQAEVHIEHGKGHFTEEDGVTELPILNNKIK